MLLDSIHLINFRQYKDFKVAFKNNNGVTVIRANNSIGKTTFMESLKWVLFGNDQLHLERKEELVNYEYRRKKLENDETEGLVSVEISLEHDGRNYSLKREQKIDLNNYNLVDEVVTLVYMDNGETKILKNSDSERTNIINKTIESWLTEKMINYFFLDGERIEKLSKTDEVSRAEISDAITAVSKLPIMRNSLESINILRKQIKFEKSRATKNDEIVNLHKELQSLNENRVSSKEKIERLSQEISDLKTNIQTIDRQLSNKHQVTNLQKERNNIENAISSNRKLIKELKREIDELYRDFRHKKLVELLSKKYDVQNLRGDESLKTIPNMDVKAIEHIIKNGVCICGTHLTGENLLLLEEQKRYQPPISNEGLIISFEHAVRLEINELSNKQELIKNKISKYFEIQTDYNKLKDIQEGIIEQINQFDEDEIKSLNNKLIELETSRDIKLNSREKLKIELDDLNNKINKKQIKYNKMLEKSQQNKHIENKLYIVDEAYDKLKKLNENEKEKQRKKIEEYTNMHLNDIVTKPKIVEIDDLYRHTVKDYNGNLTSLSSGESIALSVSIILAIIDTHRYNLKSNNKENILTEKDFFLVLDGAFAVLDQNFSEAIARKITERLNQVIILTNDNQYTQSVKVAIQSKLNNEYKIKLSNKVEEQSILTKHLQEVKIYEK